MRVAVSKANPARAVVEATPEEVERLKSLLTYRDRGVEFLISRHKKNWRWKESDPDEWRQHLDGLKSQLNQCALNRTEDDGVYWTYSGLITDIRLAIPNAVISHDVEYPEPRSVAWSHVPKSPSRPYQVAAEEALKAAGHASIELPTGSGKSRIIADICHDLGHQAVVMAPLSNIARQLYRTFTDLFGKRMVGLYGDGKKEVGKHFTIAMAQSLTRCTPDLDSWKHFSQAKVFIADESHMCPATTLDHVCMGMMASAPYRFFVSATQTRTDGSELILKGITGSVVYEKSFRELVDEGYLAKPHWKMIRVRSADPYFSDDPLKMSQRHLLYSPQVIQKAAHIINGLVMGSGRRILVLVDELEQFTRLLSLLRVEARFAHGGVTKTNRKSLPEAYHASDPSALVEAFDRGDFPVLVGTSCISTGTDILSPEVVVYLQGGTSAIQVPQAVGRGTRRGFVYPDGRAKAEFNFIDFCPVITNGKVNDAGADPGVDDDDRRPISLPYRHALARARLYENLYPGAMTWMT